MNGGSRIRTRLIVDLTLFIGFVIVSAPQATGLALHEWLSFAFVPVFFLHLLMSWSWIVKVLRRLFQRLGAEARFNSLWDLLLFGWMTFVIVTGVLASEVALVDVGIPLEVDPFWTAMHHDSSNMLFPLLGVHLGMHWRWIVNAVRKHWRSLVPGAAR